MKNPKKFGNLLKFRYRCQVQAAYYELYLTETTRVASFEAYDGANKSGHKTWDVSNLLSKHL